MPSAIASRGLVTVTGAAVELDLAAVRGGDAEERQPDVGAAGADQTGKPEHLAGAEVERDVLKRALAAQTADRQPHRARFAPLAPEELPHLAADHAADGRGRRQLGARRGRDPAAVAQDRDAVGDLEDLFHAVGDEEDRHALLAQGVHDAEELLHLVRREGGGRLVHDQDAHVEGDGLGDLDGLLLGEGQPAGRLADVEPHVEPGEDLARLALHPAPVDDLAAVAVADEDVLGDREVGEDHRLLVDGGDAEALRVLGGGDADRLRRRCGSRRCPAAGRRS